MVIGALQSCVKDIIEHASVEVLAAVKALVFTRDMGFLHIILEGDALGVINQINLDVPNLSVIGNIKRMKFRSALWFILSGKQTRLHISYLVKLLKLLRMCIGLMSVLGHN